MSMAGLHHAARRYCIERIAYWNRVYSELPSQRQADGYHYTPEALDTFPRYNVLEVVLAAIERYTPDSLASETDPRKALCDAAMTADGIMVRPPNGDIQDAAMQDERERFCEYVRRFTSFEPVEPLPYRRVLSDDEAAAIESRVEQRWPAKTYDYPLVRAWLPEPPGDSLAFKEEPFFEDDIRDRVRTALGDMGVSRVFQVGPEREWKYELDLAEFEPVYDGQESWWCDDTFAWRIFASHESLTSVAGERLISSLTARWPEYAQCLDDGAVG